MSNKVLLSISIAMLVLLLSLFLSSKLQEYRQESALKRSHLWSIRSIDTVKYSRDLAREMSGNKDFDLTIEKQIADIASLGASHVAIGTPYDPEFKPFLNKWVSAARKHNLKVWFRGNFSGWENWFGYDRITREEHKRLLKEFIENNPGLFEDGDIFTPCPECENGGPGDPRNNGDRVGHRQFLIEEYKISEESFKKTSKKVKAGFFSMNYDVATLIMDEETTKALGGIVVIDHYVKDPKKLASDSKMIAEKSKGKVVIGEYGAPIPDIHGSMTDQEQNDWIEEALDQLSKVDPVIGVNYWTNVGGSTGLWNSNGTEKAVVSTLRMLYKKTEFISPR